MIKKGYEFIIHIKFWTDGWKFLVLILVKLCVANLFDFFPMNSSASKLPDKVSGLEHQPLSFCPLSDHRLQVAFTIFNTVYSKAEITMGPAL